MNQFFKELFAYNHHCNQKLSEIFENDPDRVSVKSLKIFSHILNAHQIWNNRIDCKQKAFGVWKIHKVEDLKALDHANYEHTLRIIGHIDLNRLMHDAVNKGRFSEVNARTILFHIINHSTYHRGQIASEFRKEGLEPLATDYIFFKQ